MLWVVWSHFQGSSLCLTSSLCCFLGSLVQSRCGEGGCCKQIALLCVHIVSAPLELSLLVAYKLLRLYDAQQSKNLQAINAGEGVEKREPSYTVGGNAN